MEKSWKFLRLFLSRPRPILYCLSSRRLETKILVTRTASLAKTIKTFKKTYQFKTMCKDDVMMSTRTAKIFSVTLDGAMHGASLQADFSW